MKTLEDALAAIETMRAEHEAEKAAILKKNKELVDRERAAKTAADEAEKAREEAANDAASKAGDVDAVKASLEKKHKAAIDKLTADLAARDERLGTLLIDNAIKEAMSKNNVHPKHAEAVEAILRTRTKAKIENGEAVTADGTPLNDAMSAYFKSKDALEYVAAPANTGAGTQGSTNRTVGGLTKAPTNAAEMAQFSEIVRANPEQAKAMAKSWGWPDLEV
ncbi:MULTISPECIES: hypothetical protein [Sphingomonas]|uniref:hypothetical protein n=1 Tax=Sphingomonas TaxID=13687 RepID=UPI000F7E287C|nr:hypothetical protein [Sphingomonas sp. ABOLF]RSV14635.1 hypothetical protein CA235_11185 [Sphingomonas sp. ABOLF]GLK19237.1 hypothetical protein GCM10017606_00630 [Microbacterium terregens]